MIQNGSGLATEGKYMFFINNFVRTKDTPQSVSSGSLVMLELSISANWLTDNAPNIKILR